MSSFKLALNGSGIYMYDKRISYMRLRDLHSLSSSNLCFDLVDGVDFVVVWFLHSFSFSIFSYRSWSFFLPLSLLQFPLFCSYSVACLHGNTHTIFISFDHFSSLYASIFCIHVHDGVFCFQHFHLSACFFPFILEPKKM